MSNVTYFLGCPTPEGFETRFGEEIKSGGFFTYIIKGGPGTGKSSLMKRVAASLSDIDAAELYYCSSDPDSLDAVLFRKLGVIFVDGTAPHVFEPIYPGARQKLLDLGEFWNQEILKGHAENVIKYSDENSKLHERVRRYLGAVCDLNGDTASIGESAMLSKKLESYSKRLAAKLFPKTGRPVGKISLKQITSITPKGVITQTGAFDGCKIFTVSDPYFAVADSLLKNLSALATKAGYDVIASKNVFRRGCVYEHIVVPELKLAFLSDAADGVSINALRFYDRELLRARRRRLSFNSGLRKELVAAASETLSEAKAVHDELEKCYISAMDFDAVGRLTESLCRDLSELK